MLSAVLCHAESTLVVSYKDVPLLLSCLTENDNHPAWCYTTPKHLLKSKLTGRVITVEKQMDAFYLGNTICHLDAVLQYEVKGKEG